MSRHSTFDAEAKKAKEAEERQRAEDFQRALGMLKNAAQYEQSKHYFKCTFPRGTSYCGRQDTIPDLIDHIAKDHFGGLSRVRCGHCKKPALLHVMLLSDWHSKCVGNKNPAGVITLEFQPQKEVLFFKSQKTFIAALSDEEQSIRLENMRERKKKKILGSTTPTYDDYETAAQEPPVKKSCYVEQSDGTFTRARSPSPQRPSYPPHAYHHHGMGIHYEMPPAAPPQYQRPLYHDQTMSSFSNSRFGPPPPPPVVNPSPQSTLAGYPPQAPPQMPMQPPPPMQPMQPMQPTPIQTPPTPQTDDSRHSTRSGREPRRNERERSSRPKHERQHPSSSRHRSNASATSGDGDRDRSSTSRHGSNIPSTSTRQSRSMTTNAQRSARTVTPSARGTTPSQEGPTGMTTLRPTKPNDVPRRATSRVSYSSRHKSPMSIAEKREIDSINVKKNVFNVTSRSTAKVPNFGSRNAALLLDGTYEGMQQQQKDREAQKKKDYEERMERLKSRGRGNPDGRNNQGDRTDRQDRKH